MIMADFRFFIEYISLNLSTLRKCGSIKEWKLCQEIRQKKYSDMR